MSTMEKMMGLMMDKMKPEEKEKIMEKMMEKFFVNITKEEKQKLMEKMMGKFLADMTVEDKQKMMKSMMPKMKGMDMSKMMPQMMGNKVSSEKEGKKSEGLCRPVMETQEDFKPWEFCPCRKLCKEGFKKKSES